MTIMIKNDPFRSWQDYDLCKNFLDALTKLFEICKIVSSRYQTELFTNTGQYWNPRVNHFDVTLPYFFEENLNIFANIKADMIYKSIGVFGCGSGCDCGIFLDEKLRKTWTKKKFG